MDDVEGEDVDGEQRQRQSEQVEVTVISLSNTVSNPWTVMIKTVCVQEREREKNNTVNVKQIKNIIMNWLAHRSLFKCSLQPINRGKTP